MDAEDLSKITRPIAGAILFAASSYFYIQTNNQWFAFGAFIGVMVIL